MGVNYRKANRALQEILSYIKGIENVWNEQYNLKLYDTFFQFFQCDGIVEKELKKARDQGYDIEMDASDEFDYFCRDSYDSFIRDLEYMGIEDCRRYIGRTSSFYFSDFRDKYTYPVNRWKRCFDLENFLRDASGLELYINDKGKCYPYVIDDYTYNDCLEINREDLQYLISGKALQDVKRYFRDIIKEYEIITDFKKGQVESFTDYIRCQIEVKISSIDLEKEREKQEKEEFYINTACYTFA